MVEVTPLTNHVSQVGGPILQVRYSVFPRSWDRDRKKLLPPYLRDEFQTTRRELSIQV